VREGKKNKKIRNKKKKKKKWGNERRVFQEGREAKEEGGTGWGRGMGGEGWERGGRGREEEDC
jgi:hypothetical protein